jgi:hypothetical protein
VQTKNRKMKAGEAFAGMKRSGIQLTVAYVFGQHLGSMSATPPSPRRRETKEREVGNGGLPP